MCDLSPGNLTVYKHVCLLTLLQIPEHQSMSKVSFSKNEKNA